MAVREGTERLSFVTIVVVYVPLSNRWEYILREHIWERGHFHVCHARKCFVRGPILLFIVDAILFLMNDVLNSLKTYEIPCSINFFIL